MSLNLSNRAHRLKRDPKLAGIVRCALITIDHPLELGVHFRPGCRTVKITDLFEV